MTTERINVTWSDEDSAHVATSPAFPGLSGIAVVAEDAIAELRMAMLISFTAFAEDGEPLPSLTPASPAALPTRAEAKHDNTD